MMVIDADRHVSEPISLWKDFLPGRFKSSAPEYRHRSADKAAVPELCLLDRPLLKKFRPDMQKAALLQNSSYGDPHSAAADPGAHLRWMDRQGISAAAIFPSLAPYCVHNDHVHPELSRAFAQAYNRWLAWYCAESPSRLLGCAMISRHDPASMVTDLETIAAEGWRTLVMRSEPMQGRQLGDRAYKRFWQACESCHISVAFHGGTHLQAQTAGSDRFETRFALHACSHPMEAQMAFLALLEGGVFEDCPRLKVAFLESGCAWVPHWLWRLDQICFAECRYEMRNILSLLPSEYFKRQCWVGFEVDEPCMQENIRFIGIDRLLYGTDFPHPDHLDLTFTTFAEDRHPLAGIIAEPNGLDQILEKNPQKFFGVGR
jgi:uncharacterized protein